MPYTTAPVSSTAGIHRITKRSHCSACSNLAPWWWALTALHGLSLTPTACWAVIACHSPTVLLHQMQPCLGSRPRGFLLEYFINVRHISRANKCRELIFLSASCVIWPCIISSMKNSSDGQCWEAVSVAEDGARTASVKNCHGVREKLHPKLRAVPRETAQLCYLAKDWYNTRKHFWGSTYSMQYARWSSLNNTGCCHWAHRRQRINFHTWTWPPFKFFQRKLCWSIAIKAKERQYSSKQCSYTGKEPCVNNQISFLLLCTHQQSSDCHSGAPPNLVPSGSLKCPQLGQAEKDCTGKLEQHRVLWGACLCPCLASRHHKGCQKASARNKGRTLQNIRFDLQLIPNSFQWHLCEGLWPWMV